MTNDEKYRLMLLLKVSNMERNVDDMRRSIIGTNKGFQMFFKKTEALEILGVMEQMISSIRASVTIHELIQTPLEESEVKYWLASCKEADGVLEEIRNYMSEVG